MWVRMTRTAHRAVIYVAHVELDELHVLTFTEDVQPVGERDVFINGPYIAWKNMHGALYRRVIGPRGGRRGTAGREFTALKAITREMNYIDKHPALRGLAAPGHVPDVIPAWRIDREDRIWSPAPQPGAPFAVLTPEWIISEIGPTTIWIPRESGHERFTEEQAHLPFRRHPRS